MYAVPMVGDLIDNSSGRVGTLMTHNHETDEKTERHMALEVCWWAANVINEGDQATAEVIEDHG